MHNASYQPGRRTALAAIAGCVVADAGAQHVWPSREVQLLVPSSPGGSISEAAAIMAPALSERWRQRAQLEYLPGNGTVTAALAVSRAPADGYRMGFATSALAINAALRNNLPYDTLTDLAPISVLGNFQYGIFAHRSVPVRSATELVAYAHAARAPVPYASPGLGTGANVVMEAFAFEAGIRVAHKPFPSAPAAERAVLSAEWPFLCMAVPTAIDVAMAGPLRLVALMGHQEPTAVKGVSWASDVVNGFEITGQFSVIVPRAVPHALQLQIGRDLLATVRLPAVRTALAGIGMQASGLSNAEADAYLRADIARWRLVGRVAGIRLN